MDTISTERVIELIDRLKNAKQSFYFFNTERSIRYCLSLYKYTSTDHQSKEHCGTGMNISYEYYKSHTNLPEILHRNRCVDEIDLEILDDDEQDDIARTITEQRFAEDYTEEQKKMRYDVLAQCLTDCFSMKICECGNDFIHDDKPLCFECELLKPSPENTKECSICARHVDIRRFAKTPCCDQDLHTSCKERCESCPFCRKGW